jgi:hypothetical protein
VPSRDHESDAFLPGVSRQPENVPVHFGNVANGEWILHDRLNDRDTLALDAAVVAPVDPDTGVSCRTTGKVYEELLEPMPEEPPRHRPAIAVQTRDHDAQVIQGRIGRNHLRQF